ncbi:GIY-YIG homing endonuclease [Lactococcus phage AM4]|uniref:GIY-YIG homing endonuclease n=2 Tax=Audreyjarvisvirus AM4 TaxID=2845189 RepID=A0A1W6JKJ7_9CAUD|nr:homing endonuclease [Lactococcus phage AM4]ARM66739.1 GIY-YIG homing endonuclease [Lactococcus phage AM4]ARM66972.1 GIY-YIG homing endonuclease [Lactococcus phage AM5]
MKEKFGFVYITTCNVNGKNYIGKCQYNRKNDWKKYLGSGIELKEDIKKYGKENFTRKILEESDNDSDLQNLEEYYIKKYNAVESKEFYNLKPSSIGGDTFNYTKNQEETRRKKSENALGKNNGMYNREKTNVFLNSISDSNSKGVIIDGIYFKNVRCVLEYFKIDYNEFRRVSFKNSHEIVFPNKSTLKRNSTFGAKISVNGIVYRNKKEACKELHMNNQTINKFLNDTNNLEYQYL